MHMSFSQDGSSLAVVCRGGPSVCWHPRDNRVRVLPVTLGEGGVMTWNLGDSELVSSAGDFFLRLVDVRTGAEKTRLLLSQKGFVQMAMSPSGRFLAAVDEAGRIHVWDMERREEISLLEQRPLNMMNPPPPEPCAWSPDETRVATFGAGVRIWDWRTGQVLSNLPHISGVKGYWGSWWGGLLRWSSDSATLVWRGPRFEGAVVTDFEHDKVSLVSLADAPVDDNAPDPLKEGRADEESWFGPIRAALSSAHRAPVMAAVPSPDRNQVATLDAEGMLALWSVPLGELRCTIIAMGHAALVRTRDGRATIVGERSECRLLVGAEVGGSVRVYAPPIGPGWTARQSKI